MTNPSLMAEATRLTREGKLGEATALLQGARTADAPAKPAWADALAKGFSKLKQAKPDPAKPRRPKGRGQRPAIDVPQGARWERGTHAVAAGSRDYALYVPTNLATDPALVVMLHGCTQNADDFAVGTRMNEHAERCGFAVLYPEQPRSANQNVCWNWFVPQHQAPTGGEAEIVMGMAAKVAGELGTTRTYVAGLSAGGGMAANLAVSHSGQLSGILVHSGLPAGAATDLPGALRAMSSGGPGTNAITVPTLIIHGDADRTVSPKNAQSLAAQATNASATTIGTTEEGAANGRRFVRTTETAQDGSTLCEVIMVSGAGHGWFGGDKAGSHTEAGPDASAEAVRFFGLADG